MNDATESSTSAEFSVLVLIFFLLKIDILGLAMLIELDGDRGQVISSSSVVGLCFFLFGATATLASH